MGRGRGEGDPPNAMERWREWLRHQYVEGYYTRGRIHPLYLGPRPNRFGYVLLGSGIVFAALAVWSGLRGGPGSAAVLAGMAVLQCLAGASLLRPRGK